MKLKPVMTWSPEEAKIRLVRVIWAQGTCCLSLALVPKLFAFARFAGHRTRIVVLGVSFHYRRSGGGRFV